MWLGLEIDRSTINYSNLGMFLAREPSDELSIILSSMNTRQYLESSLHRFSIAMSGKPRKIFWVANLLKKHYAYNSHM